jgi:hypothetical protein
MRTASAGGSVPWFKKRRTFEYDAVSTSVEKVESGSSATRRKRVSSMRS